MTQPVIFISYSQKDEKEKNRLLSHLGVLQREGLIGLWSDDQIGVGANWQQEISETIAQARVAILLISANFLTSDFILGEEVPALLKRRQSEGLTVFPVIARPCAWQEVEWLVELHVKPKNGRPIWAAKGRQIDEDLATIAQEVAAIIKTIPFEPPKLEAEEAKFGTKPVKNPFYYGGPISSERLVGHRQALEFCRTKLAARQPTNIAISGERCAGKTSLLHYLSRFASEPEWGQHLCLFVDCGLFGSSLNAKSFWQEVLYQLRSKLEPDSPVVDEIVELLSGQMAPTGPDLRRFLNRFYKLNPQYPILLLLDGFELIFQGYNLEIQNLLMNLRVIAQDPDNQFTLITATREPLIQVCESFSQATGLHFHNDFVPCRLEPFDKTETEHVVQTLLAGTGIEFNSWELNYIWKLSQGPEERASPIFVQVAAYLIFEHKQQRPEPIDYYDLEQKFQEQTELYQIELPLPTAASPPQSGGQPVKKVDYEQALTIIEDHLSLDDSDLILQFYSLARRFRQMIQAEPEYHLSSTLYGEHSEVVLDLSRLSLQVTGLSFDQLATDGLTT